MKQAAHVNECVCLWTSPLCMFACLCESVATKAGSLTSHCDPDSKSSPESKQEPERAGNIEKDGEKKGRWRKAKRTGERQEKRERPITRIWAQRDKRGSERGWQTGRERELFPLGLWETEERRAWSVYVRSVVQLINLWQEGFLCFVPWIASLIYMVIFFKTLAAYKTLLFPSLLSLKPFLDSLHTYAYSEMHTRVKLNTMWLYVGADMLLGLTFLIRLFHYYSELWDISPYTS